MISLNANSLFNATNARSIKAVIDRHVDKAVDERFRKNDFGFTQNGIAGAGRSQQDLVKRLTELGLDSNGFQEAVKSSARIDELGKYLKMANSEIDRKAATEKLKQSKRRIGELEQEARQAAARGDVRKLAKIAREASSLTRNLADEAKGLVEGKSKDAAQRVAEIAAGRPDPAASVTPEAGMTAGGVPIGFAKAFVQEVRDIAGRARSLLTQAEANRGNSIWLSDEEKQELEELLKASRDDLAESGEVLERLNGTLEALEPSGGNNPGTASLLDVSYTYTRTETITVALAVTESVVSVTA